MDKTIKAAGLVLNSEAESVTKLGPWNQFVVANDPAA